MTFSQEVRQELSQQIAPARHCNLAELAAIIGMTGEILFEEIPRPENPAAPDARTAEGGPDTSGYCCMVRIRTENIAVARKCFTLLKKTFNICSDVSVHVHRRGKEGDRIYTVLVRDPKEAQQVIRALKLLDSDMSIRQSFLQSGTRSKSGHLTGSMPLRRTADSLLVQQPCCRRAFIRGAFLSAGSISNPVKSYHFEIVCASEERAQQLQMLIHTFGPDAKIVQRKKYYIVYIKEGSQIVDMLNIMEAHVSLMNLENIRIVRDVRNTVNRKVNCEAANINKTVNAAVRQMEDIRYLEAVKGLDKLPEGLAEIAELRLANPDASLKELGEMLVPPVGKSGVNHRLRKLSRWAEAIRQNKEELL